jgi:uncharacterized membrane protein
MINKLIAITCTTTFALVCFAVWCALFGVVMFAPALVLMVGEVF